jgi:hypothetical protein
MNPFQALINTIANATRSALTFIGDLVGNFVGWLFGFLTFFSAWLVSFFVVVIETIGLVFVTIATVIVGWLPEVPAPPDPGEASWLEMANLYVPIAETGAFAVTWAVIFAGVMVVKLIRLISPVSS